jgi:hypothetical protein
MKIHVTLLAPFLEMDYVCIIPNKKTKVKTVMRMSSIFFDIAHYETQAAVFSQKIQPYMEVEVLAPGKNADENAYTLRTSITYCVPLWV